MQPAIKPANARQASSAERPYSARAIRATERIPLILPARLRWKDRRGAPRCAVVVTKNASHDGVYVECRPPLALSRFQLVHFQLAAPAGTCGQLRAPFDQMSVLAAVYRVVPPRIPGEPQGLALRLLLNPERRERRTPRE